MAIDVPGTLALTQQQHHAARISWPLVIAAGAGVILLRNHLAGNAPLKAKLERAVTDDRAWITMCAVYLAVAAGAAYAGWRKPEIRPGIAMWYWL